MKNEELLNFKVLSVCGHHFPLNKWGFPYEEYGFSFGRYSIFPYLCIVNIR